MSGLTTIGLLNELCKMIVADTSVHALEVSCVQPLLSEFREEAKETSGNERDGGANREIKARPPDEVGRTQTQELSGGLKAIKTGLGIRHGIDFHRARHSTLSDAMTRISTPTNACGVNIANPLVDGGIFEVINGGPNASIFEDRRGSAIRDIEAVGKGAIGGKPNAVVKVLPTEEVANLDTRENIDDEDGGETRLCELEKAKELDDLIFHVLPDEDEIPNIEKVDELGWEGAILGDHIDLEEQGMRLSSKS